MDQGAQRRDNSQPAPVDALASRVSGEAYRQLMTAFPTGVAVITTIGPDGLPMGMTCSSLSSVTLDPPTLLVCMRSQSPTLAAVSAFGSFGVNLLHARGQHAAQIFSAPLADRFAKVRWRTAPRSGLPWLAEDAFAFAECVVSGRLPVGDHTVVLGEVAAVEQAPDSPLLYGMRAYSPWPGGEPAAGLAGPARAGQEDHG
jgi:flavin reductase (NADH)